MSKNHLHHTKNVTKFDFLTKKEKNNNNKNKSVHEDLMIKQSIDRMVMNDKVFE